MVNLRATRVKELANLLLKYMDAVYIVLWGTSWVSLFCLFWGMPVNSYKLIYWCLGIGALTTGAVLFPVFGMGSMITIPYSDLCQGLPKSGADTSVFLSTFSPSGDVQDVEPGTVALMQDCLTKVDGTLWNIVQLDGPLIKRSLRRFDLSTKYAIPAAFEKTLNTDVRDLTFAFTNHFDSIARTTSDNKIFGYDSMPSAAQPPQLHRALPASLRPTPHLHRLPPPRAAGTGEAGEILFQNGGVIEGSSSDALGSIINNILASAMKERQARPAPPRPFHPP